MGLLEEASYYSQFKLSFRQTDPAIKSLGLWQGLNTSVQGDSYRNFFGTVVKAPDCRNLVRPLFMFLTSSLWARQRGPEGPDFQFRKQKGHRKT